MHLHLISLFPGFGEFGRIQSSTRSEQYLCYIGVQRHFISQHSSLLAPCGTVKEGGFSTTLTEINQNGSGKFRNTTNMVLYSSENCINFVGLSGTVHGIYLLN